jgi:hypothetical protein
MIPISRLLLTPLPNGPFPGEEPLPGGAVRLSVLVSPRLLGTVGTTYAYSDFVLRNWAEQVLSGLQIKVNYGAGPVDAVLDCTQPQPGSSPPTTARGWYLPAPALWNEIFPPSLPVTPFAFKLHSQRAIRSYSTRAVRSFLDKLYSDFASRPEGPPSLGNDAPPHLRQMLRVAGLPQGSTRRGANHSSEQTPRNLLGLSDADLAAIFSDPGLVQDPAEQQAALEFFKTYRFHERQAAVISHQYVPQPDAPQVAKLTREFHTIVGMLGDHPSLLRQLGLVIDITAPPPPTPSGVVTVSAAVRDARIQRISIPVAYRYSATEGFFADSDAEIDRGLLRTATDAFGGDLDNAALRVWHHTRETRRAADTIADRQVTETATLQQMHPEKIAGQPFEQARRAVVELPARPTGPITVAQPDRGKTLHDRLARMESLDSTLTMLLANGSRLTAGDLTRGYRVDVLDETRPTPQWRSLCRRVGSYTVGTQVFALPAVDDEGAISGGGTSQGENSELFVHESLFSWDGWSLCAPRPERLIKRGKNVNGHMEETTEMPTYVPDEFRVAAEWHARPGSLTPLRFGHRYRFRVRAVDLAGNSLSVAGAVAQSSRFDSTLGPVPFVRHEPVPTPAIVGARRITEGESLEHLVIRNGTITEGGAWLGTSEFAVYLGKWVSELVTHVAGDPLTGPLYVAECVRYLVPPKASLQMVEYHGGLDGLDRMAAYERGRREQYTLQDSQAGAHSFDVVALRGLAAFLEKPTDPPLAFPEKKGDPFGPGEYTVWRSNPGATPYLADPMARGICFQPVVDGLPVGAATTVSYGGSWPERAPLPLRLRSGSAGLQLSSDGATIWADLGPGEIADLEYSSVFSAQDAPLLAAWSTLSSSGQSTALAGRHWMLSPRRTLRLVHAVQRPLTAPVIQGLTVKRDVGKTTVRLSGSFNVHRPSTGHLDLVASWGEPTSAPGVAPDGSHLPAGTLVQHSGHVIQRSLGYGTSGVEVFEATHEPGDTKHRYVTFRADGTTRYREYFPAVLIDDDAWLTTHGVEVTVHVPSSAAPPVPRVAEVVPIFQWSPSAPGSKISTTTRTGNALRVYLDGSWFASGEGELLGVVLPGPGAAPEDAALFSAWGEDPSFSTTTASVLPPLDATMFTGYRSWRTDVTVPGPRSLPSASGPAQRPAVVVGYPVQFDEESGRWFADIQLQNVAFYMPFLRLVLARFQPNSLPDCHLSRPVTCPLVQLAPDRTAYLSISGKVLRVELRGVLPVGAIYPNLAGQAAETRWPVVARVQRRLRSQDDDLFWEDAGPLTLLPQINATSFAGTLGLADVVDVATYDYAVLVREFEIHLADVVSKTLHDDITLPASAYQITLSSGVVAFGRRLIFAARLPIAL